MAQISEAIQLTSIFQATGDVNYSFHLGLFVRAFALSKNFKYYRAKKCVFRYIPLANVFQGGVAGQQIPTWQMIMNRTGDSTAWSAAEYDAQGALAQQFTKQKTIKYKPNLVQSVSVRADTTVGTAPSAASSQLRQIGTRPLYDAWLATPFKVIETVSGDANNELDIYPDTTGEILYWGHSILVTSSGTACEVYLEVEWEFKDPLYVTPPEASATASASPLNGVSATPCQS